MTRDIDIVVLVDDADAAIASLLKHGFIPATPLGDHGARESMIVFVDPKAKVEVDLLIAEGNPEAITIMDSTREKFFGVFTRVATLEHLLLLYLYSNQPKHLGDFASIVQSGRADLIKAERILFEMHPEMLPDWRKRVDAAINPPPAPSRPAKPPKSIGVSKQVRKPSL